MTDIRRTILWIVFIVSMMLLWDAWNKHNGQPTLFGMPLQPATTEVKAAAPMASSASAVISQATAHANAAEQTSAATAIPHEQFTITTDLLKTVIDSQGGNIVQLALLQQKDVNRPEKHVVLLDPALDYRAESGLVDNQGKKIEFGNFKVVEGSRSLSNGQQELRVVLESAPTNGLKLIKTFSFKRGQYVIGVQHAIQNVGSTEQTPHLYTQLVRQGQAPESSWLSFDHSFTGPAIYNDAGKFKKFEFKDLYKEPATLEQQQAHAENGWVAMVQHYFASAWLHNPKVARQFYVKKEADSAKPTYAVGMLFDIGSLAPGQSRNFETSLFAGPQEETKLVELAPGLDLVKDYGSFTMILAKPLFWLLNYLHQLLGNWGWAIVGLVVLLKAAFYWLNANAYRSMAKMKEVTPKVQALRERLKNEPQKMQQEMLRIYREEKVNPVGGCLPILIQIPVFIALYSVLSSSVEMRNAPWIGWINDLSVKDPYYVLPILMTLSTLLQTWLNPTPADPMQAKLMWFMPLIFSIMFFQFPAGLVLYWLTNNVLSIAQQWYINKTIENKTALKTNNKNKN